MEGGPRIRPRLVCRLAALVATAAAALAPAAAANHTSAAAPADPLFSAQWGLGQVRAEQAWHRSGGAGATIAIVDSGIDLSHPDLASKVLSGRTYLRCGAGGCGNGDWQSGPAGQRDGEPHGTHVAGIAGAATSNRRGIAGVAPAAKLLAVRVLDDDGEGTSGDVARGIRYSVARGADVINLSLGSPPVGEALRILGSPDPIGRAIAAANARGAVVVVAAGNDSLPLCEDPAFAPGVVCVTATDRRQSRASYASGTVKRDLLSVAAPGGSGLSFVACREGILSTLPPGEGQSDCGLPPSRAYGELDGTSMAAPHVAGAAALLDAQGCRRAESLSLLRRTARDPTTGERGRFSPLLGYGIVDAGAATYRARTAC